jgi:alkaline phosphatase D
MGASGLSGLETFPLGVGSFDPSVDSVVLWTWVDGERRIEWTVEDASGDVVRRGVVDGADGPVRVDVSGLRPATRYRYRFTADESSVEGATRTLPVRADRARIALACCALLPRRPFDAYGRLADTDPDLVVHLGDYIYESADPAHQPSHSCRTVDDYRARYHQYRSDADLQRLHAAAPWIALWDDHEIGDGSWRRGTARERDDERAFAERRRAARTAYDDFLPRRDDDAGPTPFDRHVRFGGLVDVIVLDARNAGREEPERPSGGPALVDPHDDRRILTADQWTWLAERVRDAPAWIVLCTQTQVSPLRLARLPNPRRRMHLEPFVNPGQWDGYPVEQRRLAALLEPFSDRTLVVSGDLHGRFRTGLDTPDGRRVPELTIPSVASTPFAEAVRRQVPIPPGLLERWLRWLNPHVDSADLLGHGACVLDVTGSTLAMQVSDPAGATVFSDVLTR